MNPYSTDATRRTDTSRRPEPTGRAAGGHGPDGPDGVLPRSRVRGRRGGIGLVAALSLVGTLSLPALSSSFAAPPTPDASQTPSSPAAHEPVIATFAHLDSNRDRVPDRVVLVDPSAPASSSIRTKSPAASGKPTRAQARLIAQLTAKLAAAKRYAAQTSAAYAKAQRNATVAARAARVAAKSAKNSRQRARARTLARRAAASAKTARHARLKARAASRQVAALTASLNKVKRAVTPVKPAPKPVPRPAPKPAPKPAPVTNPPVSNVTCDGLARTFRPVPVSSQWKVSCVNSFPGYPVAAGYRVLGLTRFDSTQGIAEVLVLRGLDAAQLRATFAHELAHAYSITTLRESQRTFFVNRIRRAGLTTTSDFFSTSVDYDASPAEIWARTQATCVGYPAIPKLFTEAGCADINATKAAA